MADDPKQQPTGDAMTNPTATTLYPVILNGDHAEFEMEWAGKDPKTRPDWPLPSFDARDWTEAFQKTNPNSGIDEGTMLGWFANALMRGFDEGRKRAVTAAAEDTTP